MKKVRELLREHDVQAIISIVLALLLIFIPLVYLYLDDHRLSPYYPTVSQDDLSGIIDTLSQPARLGRETFVMEESGKQGIYCLSVMDDAQGSETFDTAKFFSPALYFDLPEQDAEIVVEKARYMSLVHSKQHEHSAYGNLYAQYTNSKEAADKPNYRNQLETTIRKGEYYYEFVGFCKSDSFEDFLQEAVRLVNENFGAASQTVAA